MTARRKGWYWPFAVGGFLALVVVANGIFLYVAVSDPSFSVEPDYYRKALEWDRTMTQERANAELGWALDLQVGPGTGGRAAVQVRLTGRDGAPVDGATVEAQAFHSARAAQVLDTTLAPAAGHVYAAELPIRRAGLWEFHVRAVRGAETFTGTVTREIGISR